ncbi:cadmium-translocating P-type ATPase [Brevibacillus composti]|uniref:Cd(2+)-exporting ATPase n=1 Tax=Brevibacillus composti TaxID=2796470 RepID=A0A7T5EMN8_9BACL|nr:cation-translocating P-type ATPase [Brevibacillus composti]QQE75430.1 cadmium-translocating P-type ATPase [Brevibacillus composti]QUO42456.1 cadmium-translocating P-type ATPase [Brevibacillus composti]
MSRKPGCCETEKQSETGANLQIDNSGAVSASPASCCQTDHDEIHRGHARGKDGHEHCGRDGHNHHESAHAERQGHPIAAGSAGGEGELTVYRITGMDCADCARGLEKKVGAIGAVQQVSVNFGAAKMTVRHEGGAEETIVRTVRQAGYDAVLEKDRKQLENRSFWLGNRKALWTLLSGVLFLTAWTLDLTDAIRADYLVWLYAAAIAIGGFRIAKSGIYGLKSKTLGIDFLMTIAVLGAAIIGEWAEGAAVVFLFSLGETLEAYTMERTRNSLRSLMKLAPDEALVIREGQEVKLPVESIEVGEIVLVKPGDKIAMDGTVIEGHSTVNQAPITGESVPVEKSAGDDVYAGTINEQGALKIKVTRRFEENTLSKIVHLVEEAQAQKAPSQRFVDVFSQYYTPAVIAIAALIAVIPPLFMQEPFELWFYRALMMLVVACPCALVISTPVSIVSAIGNAARHGILIKGGVHLERLGAINTIAFDKTGTLTRGTPEVVSILPLDGKTPSEIMTLAASLEAMSQHPLAQAILRYAKEIGAEPKPASDFTSVTGRGVKAVVDGELYYLGNPRWFQNELSLSLASVQEEIEKRQQTGQTLMLLGTGQKVIALIGLADQLREESASVVAKLKKLGVGQVAMLTGDNRGTAEAVAGKLGLSDYRAELLPADKLAEVQKWQSTSKGVAMVGDGVNDAPALAAATVGIAMGGAGSDTAMETADITLMADDLTKLPYAIGLSRRTLAIIKQNIAFSLLIKVVFLLMILFGYSTLWMAVLADTGSSLIVIANGMRLLRSRDV